MDLKTILLVVALILEILAALGVGGIINWVAAGLAFYFASLLVGTVF